MVQGPDTGAVMYTILLADPPWPYKDKASAGKRGAEYKYSCMSMDELDDMRYYIDEIVAPDSVLFMWSTAPMLPNAFNLMNLWGYKYKTIAFTWIKTNKNGINHCMDIGNPLMLATYITAQGDMFTYGDFMGMGHHTRCLTGDTVIWLLDIEKDVFFISNMEQLYDLDISKYKIFTPFGWKTILNKWKNRKTKINKIKTQIGNIKCSDNHIFPFKYPSATKIKNTRIPTVVYNLKDGTINDIKERMNKSIVRANGHSVNLLTYCNSMECSNPITGVYGIDLNYDIGWIIGLFCAEGSYAYERQNGIRFSLGSHEICYYNRICDILKILNLKNDRYYNENVTVNLFECDDRNSIYVDLSSGMIVDLFKYFINEKGAHYKRLNLINLFDTSIEFRMGVWQGMMDGDGHLTKGTRQKLVLCNSELIKDFVILGKTIGIHSNYHEDKPQYKNNTLCYKYRLEVYNTHTTVKDIYLNDTEVKSVTIKSIEQNVGIEDTYDIEVEGNYFVANNIVTHNSNAEFVLLGIRGKGLKRVDASIRSTIISPIREHSRKPDEVKERIKLLYGEQRRLELFSREPFPGFNQHGNETGKFKSSA